jgi:hypothetical protein
MGIRLMFVENRDRRDIEAIYLVRKIGPCGALYVRPKSENEHVWKAREKSNSSPGYWNDRSIAIKFSRDAETFVFVQSEAEMMSAIENERLIRIYFSIRN